MAVNQNDIIQATIRCAYQYSLPEVTVKLIGKEAGIKGQGLYNHFESKMDILVACFNYCDRNLSNLFEGYHLDPNDDLQTSLKKLWMRYFTYFVNHPEECAFYRQFRELKDIPDMSGRDESYFKGFRKLINELEEKHHFLGKIPSNVLLYYVRSTTPYLARAISENIVGNTPELRENMWQLISGGISALWN